MCDNHLSDVLVFPSGTDLHNHPLYVSGCILLQDKVPCQKKNVFLYELLAFQCCASVHFFATVKPE